MGFLFLDLRAKMRMGFSINIETFVLLMKGVY